MFFSTAGVTSKTVLMTPFLVDSLVSNFCPSRTGGNFFILVGFVRELCKSVPPVRSIVRVFSRFRGRMYCALLAGSFRSRCVNPSQPLRIPITFFFQAEDGIRDDKVTGVQTCALPICPTQRRVGHPDTFLREVRADALRAARDG